MCKLALVLLVLLPFLPGAALAAAPSAVGGIPGDAPFVTVDPVMDGADSFVGEWRDALIASDAFVDPTTAVSPAGLLYFENKEDWLATSSSGSKTTYPGPTLFVAHDIFGAASGVFASFRTNDAGDWNSIKVTTPAGDTIECWNFAGFTNPTAPPHVPSSDFNAADDGVWLPDTAGLGRSGRIPEGAGADLIDDRGFIVRLNGDPASDRHWRPGDPEPGDPGWLWEDFYGCFARAGFNKTFQENGTDPVLAHDFNHEVYEWCFHGTTITPPVGPPVVVPPPLQCTQWRIQLVDPPKRWLIFFAPNWFIHFGPPPIPASPWPFLLATGLVLSLGGLLVFRRPPRRGARASVGLLVLAVGLAVTVAGGLAGCGGGANPKFPPPVKVPPPILKEGWKGQPYAEQLQATGQTPPFSFQLTAGNLPDGLALTPQTGAIAGTPTAPGAFSFEFDAIDALGNRTGSGSAIHIGDPALSVPIEIVSLSLTSANPILVVHRGVEAIGAIQAKGGDYFAPTQWQLAGPPPAGVFLLSPGGVVRWTPTLGEPLGPLNVAVQVINGGAPIPMQLQFDVQP